MIIAPRAGVFKNDVKVKLKLGINLAEGAIDRVSWSTEACGGGGGRGKISLQGDVVIDRF